MLVTAVTLCPSSVIVYLFFPLLSPMSYPLPSPPSSLGAFGSVESAASWRIVCGDKEAKEKEEESGHSHLDVTHPGKGAGEYS